MWLNNLTSGDKAFPRNTFWSHEKYREQYLELSPNDLKTLGIQLTLNASRACNECALKFYIPIVNHTPIGGIEYSVRNCFDRTKSTYGINIVYRKTNIRECDAQWWNGKEAYMETSARQAGCWEVRWAWLLSLNRPGSPRQLNHFSSVRIYKATPKYHLPYSPRRWHCKTHSKQLQIQRRTRSLTRDI